MRSLRNGRALLSRLIFATVLTTYSRLNTILPVPTALCALRIDSSVHADIHVKVNTRTTLCTTSLFRPRPQNIISERFSLIGSYTLFLFFSPVKGTLLSVRPNDFSDLV